MVPQHKWLFGALDKKIGHNRRYDRDELSEKLALIGFELRKIDDFNRSGFLGWLLYSRLLGSSNIPSTAMKSFNFLLPIARHLDKLGMIPAVTLLAIARKPVEGRKRQTPVRTVAGAVSV